MKRMNIIDLCLLMTTISCTSGIKEQNVTCKFKENLADCSYNKLDVIPEHFAKPFERLDLSHNNIRRIPKNVFVFAPNLTYLSLSSNNIDLIEEDGFFALPFLKELDISHNNLQEIPESFFYNLKHLRNLVIDHNHFGHKELAKKLTSFVSITSLKMDMIPDFQFPVEFTYLSNLTYLSLHVFNRKAQYNKDTFLHLASLKIFILELVCVANTTKDAFYYLHNLKDLSIYVCDIGQNSPVYDIFSSLSSFKGRNMSSVQLYDSSERFSFSLTKEYITHVDKICLKQFIMQNMFIKEVAKDVVLEMAKSFKCLEYLDISGNILHGRSGTVLLFITLFQRLKILKLQDNKNIDHPVDHKDGPASMITFSLPTTLEELYFKNSGELYRLPNVTFTNGMNLRVLSLPDNRFGDCLGSFRGIENITFFDMSGWQCTLLSENLLSSFPKLETLIASRASIGIGFKNNSNASALFKNNHLLKTIDLSYNMISFLPNGLFLSNFQQLGLVNISHNYLTIFPKFQTKIRFLQMIDLTFNRITTFTDEDLEMIENLGAVKILLSNNPLQCSCMTVKFLKWLEKSQQIDDISFVSCFMNDGRYINISNIIGNMKLFEISCVTNIWLTFSVQMTSLLILSILITVVYVRYKYAIQYLLLRAKIWWQGNPEQEMDYTYDAFISSCHQDHEWVKNLYNKMSETGLTFCVSAKDFLPGVGIAENILQAIDLSRKIIFIISRDFLKSDWCSFEVEMARMHAFQRGRDDMVIVVLKENISVEDMPNILRSIWWKVTCIEWPSDDNVKPFNTQDIFYKSLNLALQKGRRDIRSDDGIELS